MSKQFRRYTPSQVARAGSAAWVRHEDHCKLEARVAEFEREATIRTARIVELLDEAQVLTRERDDAYVTQETMEAVIEAGRANVDRVAELEGEREAMRLALFSAAQGAIMDRSEDQRPLVFLAEEARDAMIATGLAMSEHFGDDWELMAGAYGDNCDALKNGATTLVEKIKELQAQLDSVKSKASEQETTQNDARAAFQEQLRALQEAANGEAWAWVGDGSDDLGSMSEGMVVAITAGQLRRFELAWLPTTSADSDDDGDEQVGE